DSLAALTSLMPQESDPNFRNPFQIARNAIFRTPGGLRSSPRGRLAPTSRSSSGPRGFTHQADDFVGADDSLAAPGDQSGHDRYRVARRERVLEPFAQLLLERLAVLRAARGASSTAAFSVQCHDAS